MARRERPRVTGLPVHIIQRGNNRQACFYAEAHYQFFLHHLRELAKRVECEVHAYVLMTNHARKTGDVPRFHLWQQTARKNAFWTPCCWRCQDRR